MIVDDKIQEIETYVKELKGFIPIDFEEYKKDHKTKAACERYFEKIVESVIDLTFLILKDQGLSIPEEEKQGFDVLKDKGIISDKMSRRLKEAKGMRNIIAHQYGAVDDKVVFHSITEELVDDIEDFISEINNHLDRGKK
ncbi:DUF86 domain-containing protein [Nanoarchaeota archaeon]